LRKSPRGSPTPPPSAHFPDHAATARTRYDNFNGGDIDGIIDGILADDFVEHEGTPGLAPTKEGVKEFFQTQRAAFPDMRMDAQDVIASGDKVVVRARLTGTLAMMQQLGLVPADPPA